MDNRIFYSSSEFVGEELEVQVMLKSLLLLRLTGDATASTRTDGQSEIDVLRSCQGDPADICK